MEEVMKRRVTFTYTENKDKGRNVKNVIIAKLLLDKGCSVSDIADALGVTSRTAYRYLSTIAEAEEEFASSFS